MFHNMTEAWKSTIIYGHSRRDVTHFRPLATKQLIGSLDSFPRSRHISPGTALLAGTGQSQKGISFSRCATSLCGSLLALQQTAGNAAVLGLIEKKKIYAQSQAQVSHRVGSPLLRTETISRSDRYVQRQSLSSVYQQVGTRWDRRVQVYVDEVLTNVTHNRNSLDVVRNLERAWEALYAHREQECGNLALAAAEHYMWNRFQVASYSPAWIPVAAMLGLGYDALKRLLVRLGRSAPRTGGCPPVPASMQILDWEARGASHGAADWIRIHIDWIRAHL